MAVELKDYGGGITLPDDDELESKDEVLQQLYADHLVNSFEELKARLQERNRYDSSLVSRHRPEKSRERMCLFCYARVTIGNNGEEFGHRRGLDREIHGFDWQDCPFAITRTEGEK